MVPMEGFAERTTLPLSWIPASFHFLVDLDHAVTQTNGNVFHRNGIDKAFYSSSRKARVRRKQ